MRRFLACAFLFAVLLAWTATSRGETYDIEFGSSEFTTSEFESSESAIGGGDVCDDCLVGCDCIGDWRDNTYVWLAGDTYKGLGDRITNINGGTGALTGSFGIVGGFNTGFALGESRIRGQIGGSYGIYDLMGRIRLVTQDVEAEEQVYFTTGFYKRGDILHGDAISWGVVFDAFHGNQWGVNANTVDLGQIRGIAGYAVNDWTEIGVFGTLHVYDDNAAVTVAGAPGVLTPIRAMNQANLYLRKTSVYGGQVMFYAGVMDNADICDWQFGFNGLAPLSECCSLYGNFNYVIPSASQGPIGSGQEQFDFSVGLVYYFGNKASSPSVTGYRGLPLLPVANNGSFLVTD